LAKISLGSLFSALGIRNCFNYLSDERYLRILYRLEMHKRLNLDNPKTFNEKIQWLKLHDHRPEYRTMVDKYLVRGYISEKIGDEYLIPLLGVWNNPNDIEFDKLPDQFVLKCNHDSGSLVVCKDKDRFDQEKAKEMLMRKIKRVYYWGNREWPYKSVKPLVLAEQYKEDGVSTEYCDYLLNIKGYRVDYSNGFYTNLWNKDACLGKHSLTDYKFYCFNGYVDCVMVCFDRESGDTKFYFFDKDWKLKRINKRGIEAPDGFTLPKPTCLDEMFNVAAILSKGIPFVRVDLYQSDRQVYFGEMTFYPQSGLDPNYLPETDLYFGELIDLSLAYEYTKGDTNK